MAARPLSPPPRGGSTPPAAPLRYVSFNQDFTCLVTCADEGIRIYSCPDGVCVYADEQQSAIAEARSLFILSSPRGTRQAGGGSGTPSSPFPHLYFWRVDAGCRQAPSRLICGLLTPPPPHSPRMEAVGRREGDSSPPSRSCIRAESARRWSHLPSHPSPPCRVFSVLGTRPRPALPWPNSAPGAFSRGPPFPPIPCKISMQAHAE